MKRIWLALCYVKQIFKKRGHKNLPVVSSAEQARNATPGIRPPLGPPRTTESPVARVEKSPGNCCRQKFVRSSVQGLPNEVLVEILKWLDEGDLGVLQRVCSRLYAIVDELIGRKVTTSTLMTANSKNPDLRKNKEGLHLISFIGVKSFKVDPVNTEYLLEPPSSPLPSFKRPYLLKSFTVHGSLHPDLFSSMTRNLIHLTVFDITLTALAQVRHQSLVRLNLPGLKELKVQSLRELCLIWKLNYNREHEKVALPNLRTLLTENRFPLLVQLTFEAFHDFYTMRDLIRFIHAHPTLEELTVQMLFHHEYERQEHTANEENLRAIIAEIREHDYCPSLKRMTFSDWSRNRYNPNLEIWNEFAMKPSTLRSLDWMSNFLPDDDVLSTLCSRNGSTLEEFEVCQDQDILVSSFEGQLQVDCSHLSPLKCVHKLELTLIGILTGTRHLPTTLTAVFISARMASNDSEHVLLHLPNLRALHLTLDYALDDREEAHGVSLDALRRFVQNRQVAHLRLECEPIDRIPLPTEGIPNGDPVNPNALTKIWMEEYRWSLLMWDLNKDGYYVNGRDYLLPEFF